MSKLWRKADLLLLRGKMKLEEFLREERGDTNFISIAIVLIIVLVIAGAFVTFGNKILTKFNQVITEFMGKLGIS